MILLCAASCAAAALVYGTFEYRLLVPPKKGLPILMYHKVAKDQTDSLTVNLQQLEEQLVYLKERDYRCISFAELKHFHETGAKLPKRSIILTFDDAYQNNYELLLPLLEKHSMKASIFLPLGHLGKINAWDRGNDPLMDIETVKRISHLPSIELGIHSFAHKNYKQLSIDEIDQDLKQCDDFLRETQLKAVKVIAYPYGGTHRKKPELNREMEKLLTKYGYWFGLRIGNRINSAKLKNPFQLYRIDIKGTDRFFEFKIKLKKGNTKLL